MSVIISITSYPKRFPTLHLCLETLLKQHYKPDNIILYLHQDDIASKNITDLQQKGLEIKYFTEDFKPHNKYIHAMREYPNDVIVTFDDDALYPPHLLGLLVKTHKQFPDAVVAGRAHKIRLNEQGNLFPYLEWGWEIPYYNTPSLQIIATGIGGVLYPPKCMHQELFNTENIRNLCLCADDIWLKCMQVLNGTPVVIVPQFRQHPPSIKGVAETGLYQLNNFENRNDLYLSNMTNKYNINWEDIIDVRLETKIVRLKTKIARLKAKFLDTLYVCKLIVLDLFAKKK